MDLRQLSEFKRLIENSREIALVPSLETRGESLFSALALLFSLDNLNRKTSLLLESLPPSIIGLEEAQSWRDKPTIIINRPSADKISQIRYNKNNGRVYLHINAHNDSVRAEDVAIAFEPFKNEPDLFICLGFSSSKQIVHPQFRQRSDRAAVVNIDNHRENETFGQVNLINPGKPLAEIVANAIKAIDENLIDQRVSAYLLKGLKLYTSPQEFSNNSCQWIAELVNQEALSYIPNPCTTEDIEQLSLLERSIRKLEFYPAKNLAVLGLPYWENQGLYSNDIIFLIEELKSRLLDLKNLIVLWQPKRSLTQGIVYLDEKDRLKQLSHLYPGQYQESRGLFTVNQPDLSIIKKQLTNYLLSL